MLRSLATALDAGMSLEAFVADPRLRATLPDDVARCLRASLRDGGLGQKLGAGAFVDDAGAAIIDAGVDGGFLPKALRAVADHADEKTKRRRRALMALAYPGAVALAAVVVLPLPSIVAGGVSAWAKSALPGVVAIVGFFVAVFVAFPRLSPRTQAALARVLAKVPVVGNVVVDDGRAAFADTMARLLGAGVSVGLALPRAITASGLAIDSDGVVDVIRRGGTFTEALHHSGAFEPESLAMLAVAEQTGTLDQALAALSTSTRDRARRRFMAVAAVVGVVVGVGVAIAVGAAIISGYVGYFETIERATAE